MRTATPETRKALRGAIGDGTQAAWARRHGIREIDVSDCRRGRPMSPRRENAIRRALGLSPIRRQLVEIDDNQYVATRTRPRPTKRRAATMTPEMADYADRKARAAGYTSWGAMEVAELQREMGLDLVYDLSLRRNGHGHTCEQDSYDRPTTATN